MKNVFRIGFLLGVATVNWIVPVVYAGGDGAGGGSFYFNTLGPTQNERRMLDNTYQGIFENGVDKTYVTTPWMRTTSTENSVDADLNLVDALEKKLSDEIQMVTKGTLYEGQILSTSTEFTFAKVCLDAEIKPEVFSYSNEGGTKLQFSSFKEASEKTDSLKVAVRQAAAKDPKQLESGPQANFENHYAVNIYHSWYNAICNHWIVLGRGRAEIQINPQIVVNLRGEEMALKHMYDEIKKIGDAEKKLNLGLSLVPTVHIENGNHQTVVSDEFRDDGGDQTRVHQTAAKAASLIAQGFEEYRGAIDDLYRDFGGIHPTADRELIMRYTQLLGLIDKYKEDPTIKYKIQVGGDAIIDFNNPSRMGKRRPIQIIDDNGKPFKATFALPSATEIQGRLNEVIEKTPQAVIVPLQQKNPDEYIKNIGDGLIAKVTENKAMREALIEYLESQNLNDDATKALIVELKDRGTVQSVKNRLYLIKIAQTLPKDIRQVLESYK